MRTFLNHIRNETLDEIKTSLENLWQQMIQLSEFFQYSFVLILKRKCLVRASGVRSGESGTPSTIIYVRWSSRRYELGCDAPVCSTIQDTNRSNASPKDSLWARATRWWCQFKGYAIWHPYQTLNRIFQNCIFHTGDIWYEGYCALC